MSYNWQQENWSHFTYDIGHLEDVILELTARFGRTRGFIE